MQATTKQNVNPESIKKVIATKVDSAGFTTWIMPLGFEVNDGVLNVVAHNKFAADYVKKEYGNIIKDIAADFCLDLNVSVANAAGVSNRFANDNVVCSFVPEKTSTVKSSKHNAFDDFICVDENMFAVAACKKMAMGGASFSQLFIYGPAGCGKSLLANSILFAKIGYIIESTEFLMTRLSDSFSYGMDKRTLL